MWRHVSAKLSVIAALAVVWLSAPAFLAADTAGSLKGVVKSSSGEALSGAYVKVHNEQKRFTFMVVTQDGGRFTVNSLPPGKYTVQGIGNGFQSAPKPVDVSAGKAATADVSLTAPQAAALPNGWPGRPGKVGGVEMWVHEPQTPLVDGDGKPIIQAKCMQCHETERMVLLRMDHAKWQSTVTRMREYMHDQGVKEVSDDEAKTVVDYLTKNYSGEPGTANARPDQNSRLPRTLVKGDAAKYIAFDLELPTPDRDPHDLTVDPRGNAWIAERNGCCLAKVDAKTFAFTEFTPPAGAVKSRLSSPIAHVGDLVWIEDASHNRRWLSFDTKAEKFTAYPAPDTIKGSITSNTIVSDPKGRLWAAGNEHVMGLDPKTGKFVAYDIPYWLKNHKSAQGYGMAVSGDGKVWFAERDPSRIGRLDPDSGKIDEYEPPIPNSIPRRMGADSAGNIWVGLHEAGKLMKIDFETTKMTLYNPPTENSALYTAAGDPKTGIVWFSEQGADKIGRFDPKTETFTEFSVPNSESDMRRIELDPTNPNRIWWGGDTANHIGYIEVLK
jgi:streptogramin lyase/cytochrome c5